MKTDRVHSLSSNRESNIKKFHDIKVYYNHVIACLGKFSVMKILYKRQRCKRYFIYKIYVHFATYIEEK